MAHCEVDSFVSKFKHLWHAGVKASLRIEAVNGQASVILSAGLGPIPPPDHPHGHHGLPPRHHRGPAYHRRQERRRAAREAADQTPSVEELDDVIPAAQAGDTSAVLIEQAVKSKESSEDEKMAEEAKNDFSCLICDFKSNWASGLQIHMTRKHGNIDQIDGNDTVLDDPEEDQQYSNTSQYWKTGNLGTIFQIFLDVNSIIDGSNLSEESKVEEKAKALEARKCAFGSDFHHVPPWNVK